MWPRCRGTSSVTLSAQPSQVAGQAADKVHQHVKPSPRLRLRKVKIPFDVRPRETRPPSSLDKRPTTVQPHLASTASASEPTRSSSTSDARVDALIAQVRELPRWLFMPSYNELSQPNRSGGEQRVAWHVARSDHTRGQPGVRVRIRTGDVSNWSRDRPDKKNQKNFRPPFGRRVFEKKNSSMEMGRKCVKKEK